MSWTAFDYARCTELIEFGFDEETAAAMTDACLVLEPHRFAQTSGGGVSGVSPSPCKRTQVRRAANAPVVAAAPSPLPGVLR